MTDRTAQMRDAAAALVPALQARAAALDATGSFPAEDVAALRQADFLSAPLPERLGGLGVGTECGQGRLTAALLRCFGRGNLAVARLYEAHVNALRLIVVFGTPAQQREAAEDVLAGHLFGLWVTDTPRAPALQAHGGVLSGAKGPCSGAGHCTRALVTVGERMAVIGLDGREAVTAITGLQGMRAAANGVIGLDGVRVRFWLGAAGDYLREPDFSCGAWRGSAAASGALDALVAAVAADLRRKQQDEAPMQQARFGMMLIAQETARLWVERAASIAEDKDPAPALQVAIVNLARIAVESACLDALREAQRSLGLAAFVAPHPVERIARDLGTYLRQPAPDAVLLEAASWTLRQG